MSDKPRFKAGDIVKWSMKSPCWSKENAGQRFVIIDPDEGQNCKVRGIRLVLKEGIRHGVEHDYELVTLCKECGHEI